MSTRPTAHPTEDSDPAFRRRITLLSAAGTFLDGYDLAVIAVALPVLRRNWDIPTAWEAPLAASAVVGMFVGALVVGRLTDRVGRKTMYLIDLVGFVVFALATAAAQDVWQLLIFRFLLGLALGADYPISSTLLAEHSPPEHRGTMMCRMGAAWFAGSATAYIVGAALTPLGSSSWRWMLLLGAVLAAAVIWLRRAIPESPMWMAEQAAPPDETPPPLGVWRVLLRAPVLRWTLFCCGFWALYTTTYYGITIYTPTILARLTDRPWQAAVGSGVVALIGLAGAGIGILAVDRIGRRPLIIASFAGLTIALAALALTGAEGLVLVAGLLALAVMCANAGPGILDFLYPTELLPTRVRATGSGLASSVSRIGGILGVLVFPGLIQAWGLSSAMWLFVGCGAAGTALCLAMAPETRGRSLEDLTRSLYPRGVD